jgi:hypothetical protein
MSDGENRPAVERCGGCGLEIAGGAAGCQSLMDEVLALHFGDARYFGAHRLFVDAYAMQHPDRYCVSFKSLAAHLAHLCWSLERGGDDALPSEAIRRWVERHPGMARPTLPSDRGALTIADVARGPDPAEHHRSVKRWARATWDAYEPLHALAREWVRQALEAAGSPVAGRRRSG